MSWVLDQQELHITAGSMPQIRIEGNARHFDLQNELQMIKSALLYADHAKLCSFAPAALFNLAAMTDVPQGKRLEFLQEAASWPMTNPTQKEKIASLVEEYQHAKRRRYSKRGQLLLKQFEEQLDENWHFAKQKMEGIISEAGGQGIVEAVRSELLDVHTFRSFLTRPSPVGFDANEIVREYVEVLGGAVSDAHTYPLFDEVTGALISSRIADGTIPVSNSGIERSKRAALAADLFARLPLFPKATVKEILDIRSELERPLRRFRSAIITFSQNIQEAPWDDEFAQSAESLFRQEVEPSILTIEEQVNSNRYLNELTSRLVPVGAAAITTLAVSMTNLPSAAIVALSAIGATIGVATATQAYVQWAKDRQMTEQNQLYFYYKAGQFLADGTYEYVSDKVE